MALPTCIQPFTLHLLYTSSKLSVFIFQHFFSTVSAFSFHTYILCSPPCPYFSADLTLFFPLKSDRWSWQSSLIVYDSVKSLSTQMGHAVWKTVYLISVNVTVECLSAFTRPAALSLFYFPFTPTHPSFPRGPLSVSPFSEPQIRKECFSNVTVQNNRALFLMNTKCFLLLYGKWLKSFCQF